MLMLLVNCYRVSRKLQEFSFSFWIQQHAFDFEVGADVIIDILPPNADTANVAVLVRALLLLNKAVNLHFGNLSSLTLSRRIGERMVLLIWIPWGLNRTKARYRPWGWLTKVTLHPHSECFRKKTESLFLLSCQLFTGLTWWLKNPNLTIFSSGRNTAQSSRTFRNQRQNVVNHSVPIWYWKVTVEVVGPHQRDALVWAVWQR